MRPDVTDDQVGGRWVGRWIGVPVDEMSGLAGSVAVMLALALLVGRASVADPAWLVLLVPLLLGTLVASARHMALARGRQEAVTVALAEERERAQAQAELLESAVDTVSDGLLVVGEDGAVLSANPAARLLLPALGVDAPAAIDEVAIARALRGERVLREDVVVPGATGPRVLSVSAAPLPHPPLEGGARVVATFRDVTEERRQIDELAAFAGVVAHDLRGPIAAMLGWCETAEDLVMGSPEPDPVEIAALLSRLGHGTRRLDKMVANLLLHATSRDRAMHTEPVDLASLVDEITDARDVRALVELGPLPKVCGDVVMLHHLMDNLIGNAMKFVPAGVEPRVMVTGEKQGERVRLAVVDNGIGVPEGMRQKVFQRFERVPGTGLGGTGMGLSICQTIVERHGGEISIDDGPDGQGSTFRLTLPAA